MRVAAAVAAVLHLVLGLIALRWLPRPTGAEPGADERAKTATA
ncbi:hypothetical protein ACWGN5_01040 [Streptomyces sp. NPDC055815]